MKLRKILAGFLAGAVAMSSMVFSASAEGETTIWSGSFDTGTTWSTTEDVTGYANAKEGDILKITCSAVGSEGYHQILLKDMSWGDFEAGALSATAGAASLLQLSAKDAATVQAGFKIAGYDATVSQIDYISVLPDSETLWSGSFDTGTTWSTTEDVTGFADAKEGDILKITCSAVGSEGYHQILLKDMSWGDFEAGALSATAGAASLLQLSAKDAATVQAGFKIAGYDATVTKIELLKVGTPATTYALTLPTSTTGGKVTSDVTDATAVEEGTDVTITVTPDTGYEVDKVTVGGKEVALTNGKYTFEMTADTAVTATFKAIEVTAVALDKTALDLDIGGVYTFTTTITPDDALDQTLTWTSSDTAVATVVNGKVTAVAAGTATITATAASGVKATCTVTVSEEEAAVVNVTGVTLDKTTAELEIGGTVTLKATVAPVDATDDSVTWKSSDAAVATVDANGVVKAVAVGTATITVTTTDGAKTATCTVTVKETAKDTGYDKAEADFAPEKIVSQTATTADGKTHKRFVIKVSEESVKDKNTVVFTLSNGTETKTVESKNSYAALSASGVTVTVEEGYVFLVLTVNNIPDGITVTCTGYEVVNK